MSATKEQLVARARVIVDELNKILAAIETFDPSFEKGDEVVVYDRYRFAIPLRGHVVYLSAITDSVEIELITSNNPTYPIGSRVWVSVKQLGKVKL